MSVKMTRNTTWLLVTFGAILACASAARCPEPESIAPCECSESSGEANGIVCLHLESLDVLKQVMAVDLDDPFPSLYINFADFGDMSEPGIFGNNRFQYIGIEGGNVSAVSAETFAGLEDVLVDLGLYGNLLTDFPYEILPNFPLLQRFSIGSNPITEIRPIVSDSLVAFFIDDTEITEIPADTFVGAPNIQTLLALWSKTAVLRDGFGLSMPSMYNLFMGANEIVEVEPTALHFNSPQLYYIDLGINNITSIPAGGISGILPDTWIALSSNLIEEFSEDVFRAPLELMATAGGSISIDGNPIRCDCSIAWFARSSGAMKAKVYGTCADGETNLSYLSEDDFAVCE